MFSQIFVFAVTTDCVFIYIYLLAALLQCFSTATVLYSTVLYSTLSYTTFYYHSKKAMPAH